MKRQAGGTAPGTHPADAMEGLGGGPSAGAGPTGYASASHLEAGGAELLEDRTLRISGGGHGRRFGLSVPGALAGTFLVAALALGAALGPMAADPAGGTGAGADIALADPSDAVDGTETVPPVDVQVPEATGDAEEPKVTGAPAQTAPPEPTAVPAPAATEIQLGVALDGAAVVIEWSACEVDDFVAYKVIRSKDEYAKWPLGAGDSLAAAIGDRSVTRFVDTEASAGRTYRYAVVALRTWNAEPVIACSTGTATVTTPAPTPKPTPADGGVIGLEVALMEAHPFLDWTECTGLDFDYYKVVRSTDATVTWPTGDGDSLVAAIGADGKTKAWDGEAPGGTTVYYRVFCVRSTEAGYVSLATSAVKGIETPVAQPAPEPVALGLEAGVSGEGVILSWGACAVDGFVYYKVVRSLTTDKPSYLPWTDGTELIGVIENSGSTQFVDANIASGQTIYYRIQCLGKWNGTKVLLGQTAVVAVTIP
jgi:hypothetical protein